MLSRGTNARPRRRAARSSALGSAPAADRSRPAATAPWPRWRAAVAALREQLDVANARAERAEADRADERLRADNLRAQIDVLNAEIVVMRAEADREMAEERLRADWLSE